ncbi:MAG: UDP-N-acetylmuramate--L-alanine ligase [Rikenellaceae bacterium]
MQSKQSKRVYFVGVGGIGMSALARFFLHQGFQVAGYDRTHSPLIGKLEEAGIVVTLEDQAEAIPSDFQGADTLVIYTPAIPTSHPQLAYFAAQGNRIIKRSQALGELTANSYLEAVAGTHGKSSTSTMAAWFNQATGSQSAFLGAISKNYGTNMIMGEGEKIVVEADEFDRSFLQLYPDSAVITAADADHLDIYGTPQEFQKAFEQFAAQIKSGGRVIIKKGVELNIDRQDISTLSYSLDDPSTDYHAKNITALEHGEYSYDLVTPRKTYKGCRLGVPGLINLENSIAATALIDTGEVSEEKLKEAMRSFKGIERRFDLHISTNKIVYMDDYAHHPTELEAMLTSVRSIYQEAKITIIFQPHLFTRTKDFCEGFASALSLADNVILLPIYPAREEPIEGVTSQIIYDRITAPKMLIEKEQLLEELANEKNLQVVVTAGAGDIDRLVPKVKELLKERVE